MFDNIIHILRVGFWGSCIGTCTRLESVLVVAGNGYWDGCVTEVCSATIPATKVKDEGYRYVTCGMPLHLVLLPLIIITNHVKECQDLFLQCSPSSPPVQSHCDSAALWEN